MPIYTVYAKKTDKFGIIFWLLVDAKSKYLCNGKPYLGKDPTRTRENDLAADVCLWLMQTFVKKGYNATMDNFFTSINLADKLKEQKTTLLGTVRKQRKKIPKVETMMKSKPLYSTVVYQSPSNATLTIYKAKKANILIVASKISKLEFI